jgi:hypothetical protein
MGSTAPAESEAQMKQIRFKRLAGGTSLRLVGAAIPQLARLVRADAYTQIGSYRFRRFAELFVGLANGWIASAVVCDLDGVHSIFGVGSTMTVELAIWGGVGFFFYRKSQSFTIIFIAGTKDIQPHAYDFAL